MDVPSVMGQTMPFVSTLNIVAVVFAVLGAGSEIAGLVMVVRQIGADRGRARKLLDKQRNWQPERRSGPRRVSASSINVKPGGVSSLQAGGSDRHLAGMFASLITAHNELVHDVVNGLDQRTGDLLEEIDKGDKELRDVLRELLGDSIRERLVGVIAIGVGITLSMFASILSTVA